VVAYRPAWAREGEQPGRALRGLLPGAVRVEHFGSTSVPGLPAKDCIDLMVQVADLGESDVPRGRSSCAAPSDGPATRAGSRRSPGRAVRHRPQISFSM
jgi:GrpB-like predicted nucleotidyltransferase (UPF0157 family)